MITLCATNTNDVMAAIAPKFLNDEATNIAASTNYNDLHRVFLYPS
jgi:hypothetical protein